MSKTRILIADPFEVPGGEEEVAFYIYENLGRDKYEVYITGNEQSRYFVKHNPKENELVKVFVKGKFSLMRMLSFRLIVKKMSLDIINVHGYSAGFFVRIACAGMRKPWIVWTTHGNVDLMFKEGSFKQWLNTHIENILNRNRFFTDEIVTVCKDGGERLRKRGVVNIPMRNIYNGIDTSRFSMLNKDYNLNSKTLKLGFFSRMSRQKDLPLLLQSVKWLKDNSYDITLLLAGDGDEKEYVVDFINKNSLNDIVNYIGFRKDVLPLFHEIDVLLLPTHFECLPMILLESMCTGTPVIASDVGGVAEIVHNGFNGYVVMAENKDVFIEKIVHYYNVREDIEKHGRNAKGYILKNFDVSTMIQQYDEIFLK